ncbi:MAG: porin [Planctomycetota bacterium]
MRSLILLVAVLLAPALLAHDHEEFVERASPEVNTSLDKAGLGFKTDGFEFNLTTAVQFRYTYHDTRGEGANGDNGRDFSNFRFPGVRTFIHGHIFDPSFQYRLWLVWSWAAAPRIEDAYFRWAPESYFNLTVGQMRVPASWEYLVDHEHTGLPDRAIADEAFKQGWGKGVAVSGRIGLFDAAFDEALLVWEVGIFNGVLASTDGAQGRGAIVGNGVNVTDADATEHFKGGFRNDDWKVNSDSFSQLVDSQLMFAGRVEFHPMGEVFRHMVDLGAIEDSAAWFFMIGVAANWMSARTDGVGTFLDNFYYGSNNALSLAPPASGRKRVDASIFHATVDGHFRWIGLSINWALHFRSVGFRATGRLQDFDLEDDQYLPKGVTDYGATVDIGYFVLRDEVLIAARFSMVDFDEFKSRQQGSNAEVDGDAFGADSYEYGGGVSWLIHGDNLKLTADYRYVTQQLPHGRGPLSRGVLKSDYRVFQEIRLQLQWIF